MGCWGGSALPWRWLGRAWRGACPRACWKGHRLPVLLTRDPWVLGSLTDPVTFVLVYVMAKQE